MSKYREQMDKLNLTVEMEAAYHGGEGDLPKVSGSELRLFALFCTSDISTSVCIFGFKFWCFVGESVLLNIRVLLIVYC